MRTGGIVTFNALVNTGPSTIVWQTALDAAHNLRHQQFGDDDLLMTLLFELLLSSASFATATM